MWRKFREGQFETWTGILSLNTDDSCDNVKQAAAKSSFATMQYISKHFTKEKKNKIERQQNLSQCHYNQSMCACSLAKLLIKVATFCKSLKSPNCDKKLQLVYTHGIALNCNYDEIKITLSWMGFCRDKFHCDVQLLHYLVQCICCS